RNSKFFNKKIGTVLSIFITQYLVFLTWIPFRVKETEVMLYSMQKYIFLDLQIQNTIHFVDLHKLPIAILVLFVFLHVLSYRHGNLLQRISGLKPVYWIGFLTCIMILIFLFFDGKPQDFVYFQF
ncbi:MAG: MBOAT family protein, partial [Thaumarchaeota archaeon]|nr:MBOAT family protein [Nitrososphaerota archaeon]